MQDFVGTKLEEALLVLKQNNKKIIIIDNNFKVEGDTKLVTKTYENNDTVYLTISSYIFTLKGI